MREMNENPIISVIITVRNEEKTIEYCINSLLNQSLPTNFYEIIVVDGNSKDKTIEIVQNLASYSPVKLSLIQQEGYGISSARNTGIKYSSGKILAFIDGDAFAHNTWLEEYVKCFNTYNEKLGFVWGPVKIWNYESKVASLLYTFFYSQLGAHGVNIAFRKTALEDVDCFDEYFVGRSDENVVFLKLSKKGYVSKKCDRAVVSHNLPTSLRQFLKLEFYDGYYGYMIVQKYYNHSEKLRFYLRFMFKSLLLLILVILATSVTYYGIASVVVLMLIFIVSVLTYTKTLKSEFSYNLDLLLGGFILFLSCVYRLIGELIGIVKVKFFKV